MILKITGDMHGDWKKLHKAVNEVVKSKELDEVGYLLITGDWGFLFADPENELARLEQYAKTLHSVHVVVLFLMGNHENYTYIRSLPTTQRFGGTVTNITANGCICQLHTGNAYTICSKKIFVFGGAASTDIAWRKSYELDTGRKIWWPEELPGDEEYRLGTKTMQENDFAFDIICTHTAPLSAVNYLMNGESQKEERPLNNYLEYVNESVSSIKSVTEQPKWFFGHYHLDCKFKLKNTCFRAIFEDVILVV